MTLGDQFQAQAEKFDLPAKAKMLGDALEKVTQGARQKSGQTAHDKRGNLSDLMDKAANAVNDRTGGKHADKVAKVRQQADRLVDNVAQQRHVDPNAPMGTTAGSATPSTTATTGTGYGTTGTAGTTYPSSSTGTAGTSTGTGFGPTPGTSADGTTSVNTTTTGTTGVTGTANTTPVEGDAPWPTDDTDGGIPRSYRS